MKKAYILLVILIAPFFTAVAQDPDLFDHRWFVHSVRDSNVSNYILEDVQNTNTELRFEMIFENDRIIIQGCCGGILEITINYIGNDEIEIVDVIETESIPCEISFVTVFYQYIKVVFESMVGKIVPNTIQFLGNMHDGVLYGINLPHPENNSFVEVSNFPNEMVDASHSAFSNNFDPEVHSWSLVEMHYNGEVFELPYGAAKTIFNIYDGSFEVDLCGTVKGNMNFSWTLDVKTYEGYCFISCGVLENIADTCEVVAGIDPVYLENFKQNIYDFFEESISPVGEEMYYNFSSHPPYYNLFYKLVIKSYPDNQLIFYSNENYMDIDESSFASTITLYPNPTENKLFIHHQNEGEIKVSLYNLTGQLLLQEVFNHNNNQLSLKGFPSGTYFLVVENQGGQKIIKKVVKKS